MTPTGHYSFKLTQPKGLRHFKLYFMIFILYVLVHIDMLDADKTNTDSDEVAVKKSEPTAESAQPTTIPAKKPNYGKIYLNVQFF